MDPSLQLALVTPPTPPRRWMLFLHGILGSGTNLRALARRLVEARPSWGAALVDLRLHGASRDLPPPHTLAAAAADLATLTDAIPGPIAGITGHSFGGKVALQALAQRPQGVEVAWVLDAMPGPRPGGRGSETTLRTFEALERAGQRFDSRQQFVDRIVALGHDEGTARWLAMNLDRDGDSFVLALDLPALRAMLDDYFARDLWGVIEAPPPGLALNLVVGGKSRVFDAAELARATTAAQRSSGRVAVHTLPQAGHWVHIDEPDRLFALMSASM